MEDDDITITAEGATIRASEKVKTGEYETATVSTEVDFSIEGVETGGSVPDGLAQRLYGIQRSLQGVMKSAADERKKQSPAGEASD